MIEGTKHCPFCAEEILILAIKCKHCGSDLEVGLNGQEGISTQSGSFFGSKKPTLISNQRILFLIITVAVVYFIGNFHIVTGGRNGPKVVNRDAFGFTEIFIDVNAITGMPWILAQSRYPLGCRVLAREHIIESENEREERTMREMQQEINKTMRSLYTGTLPNGLTDLGLETPSKLGDIRSGKLSSIKSSDISSRFVDNNKIGKLFVIIGKVKNEDSMACSSIQITGKIYTKDKALAKTETVLCGNILSDKELAIADSNTLQQRLQNRSGDSRSNEEVLPGTSIPFMIVFSNLPVNLAEFTTEITNKETVKHLSSTMNRIKSKVEGAETETAKSPSKEHTSGNASSGGDGTDALVKQAIASYKALIPNHIENNWVFNEKLVGGQTNLKSVIVIKIMPNGEITDSWFEKKSGNSYFDDTVYKSVNKSNPLPPLPREYTQPYYELGLIFTPKGLKRN